MNGVKTSIVNGNIFMHKLCTVTKEEFSVTISFPKYVMWKEEKYLIQDVFPELTSTEREFMITGWTPAEWDALEWMEKCCDKCGKEDTTCLCDMD